MKTIIFPAIAVAAVVLLSGCKQPVDDGAVERERILVLEQELATLQKKQPEMVSLNEIFDNMTRNQMSHELVMRYLELIDPPPNASPEQIRQYIYRLTRLVDMPVQDYKAMKLAVMARLSGLGREYLPDLLFYAGSHAVREVVAPMVKPEDKEMLRNLAVTRMGAQSILAGDMFLKFADKSDKDTLLYLLRTNTSALHTITQLELEKEAMPIIKQRLLGEDQLQNFDQFFDAAMRNMEDAERPEFFRRVLRNVKILAQNNSWQATHSAIKMASYGCLGAFHFVMDNKNLYHNYQDMHRKLLMMSEFDKIENMESWYEANKDNLVFDPDKKIYKVAK